MAWSWIRNRNRNEKKIWIPRKFFHDIDFLRRLPQLDRESAVVASGRFFSRAFVKFLSRSNFALFESCGKVTFLFLDLNECESPEENPCSKHATCTNTIGSVTCQCKKETIFTNFYKKFPIRFRRSKTWDWLLPKRWVGFRSTHSTAFRSVLI